MIDERKYFNMGICPACRSGRIKVTSTTKPRRRLKCMVCGQRWQTLEIVEGPDWVKGVFEILLIQGRLTHLSIEDRRKILSITNS